MVLFLVRVHKLTTVREDNRHLLTVLVLALSCAISPLLNWRANTAIEPESEATKGSERAKWRTDATDSAQMAKWSYGQMANALRFTLNGVKSVNYWLKWRWRRAIEKECVLG